MARVTKRATRREPRQPERTVYGSLHSCEIVQPLTRFYKERTEIPVECNIMRYYGVGVHYYASVKEHRNPVLVIDRCDNEQVWAHDDGSVGREFDKRFDKYEQAERWVRNILRRHFKGQPYTWGSKEDYKWHYREGD